MISNDSQSCLISSTEDFIPLQLNEHSFIVVLLSLDVKIKDHTTNGLDKTTTNLIIEWFEKSWGWPKLSLQDSTTYGLVTWYEV